ncbi:MAG: hypothetical protein J6C44_10035 [Muribaculaceae bacterium]|nr:hypothetical protein [Muribaculaceae bacterium]
MTTDDKKLITVYLSGPRDWNEGVQLYNRFGQNLRLKRQFAIDNTLVTREIMFDELRKLAGLSELEFARLPRLARSPKPQPVHSTPVSEPRDIDDELEELADSFGVTVDEMMSADFQDKVLNMDENADRIEELEEELDEARSKYAETPEPMRKMIRFRERFPFLNSTDCPDVIKIGLADMFTAYAGFKEAHRRLRVMGDDADAINAAKDCEQVVEDYINNREIWDELEHYKSTGQILGKAVGFKTPELKENLAEMPEAELIQKLQSARSNTSKNKKAMDAATDDDSRSKARSSFESWNARREALQNEVNRRKKK